MAWYSILPSHLTTYETWIIRAFLILAIINLAPWLLAIAYDLLYYIFRQVWHEVPIWGGRARGQHRPRAPSLRDRSRRMSFRDIVTGAERPADDAGAAQRSAYRHQKSLSSQSIEEEKEAESDSENRG